MNRIGLIFHMNLTALRLRLEIVFLKGNVSKTYFWIIYIVLYFLFCRISYEISISEIQVHLLYNFDSLCYSLSLREQFCKFHLLFKFLNICKVIKIIKNMQHFCIKCMGNIKLLLNFPWLAYCEIFRQYLYINLNYY